VLICNCLRLLDILDSRAFPYIPPSRGHIGLTKQVGLVPVDYLSVICPSEFLQSGTMAAILLGQAEGPTKANKWGQ